MKRFAPIAALLTAILLTGCTMGGTSLFTAEPAAPGTLRPDGTPVVARFTAENRGMYLFNCIPLWSGNPNRPNLRKYDAFSDRVTPAWTRYMMDKAAMGDRRVAGIEDFSSTTFANGAFSLWIVWHRGIRSTATAVGPRPGAE